MSQPFPRPRLRNNLIVLAGLKSFPWGCLHTHWALIYSHSWPGSGPRGTGHTSYHWSHKPSLWPNHKTFQSGSSVSCTSCLAAFPRGCLRSRSGSEQDFPPCRWFFCLPWAAAGGARGMRRRRGKEPGTAGAGWGMLPSAVGTAPAGPAGKSRAGCAGGRWEDTGDRDAGRREGGGRWGGTGRMRVARGSGQWEAAPAEHQAKRMSARGRGQRRSAAVSSGQWWAVVGSALCNRLLLHSAAAHREIPDSPGIKKPHFHGRINFAKI